jgi:hypothetical protein
MASGIDLGPHIGGDFFHRSEPDVALRRHLFEKLGEHMPAGEAACNERMHDWRPQGAVSMSSFEFA